MNSRVEDYCAISLDGTTYAFAAGHEGSGLVPSVTAADVVDAFRASMRRLAAGVVMVTTRVDDKPWGLTISSCCSISLSPPRLLVSLQRRTASCRGIMADRLFGVSVLAAHQSGLARYGAVAGAAKFIDDHCDENRGPSRSPMITGAISHLDCAVAAIFDGGDHALILGDVLFVAHSDQETGSPLLYFDGAFRELGDIIQNRKEDVSPKGEAWLRRK